MKMALMHLLSIFLVLLHNYADANAAGHKWGAPVLTGTIRGRCGRRFSADCSTTDTPADWGGVSPCCSPYGWCGDSPEHCECVNCVDFRNDTQSVGYEHSSSLSNDTIGANHTADQGTSGDYKWGAPVLTGENRGRCGRYFMSDCSTTDIPTNWTGVGPCCSPFGWCGDLPAHCECMGCVDFRDTDNSGKKPVTKATTSEPSTALATETTTEKRDYVQIGCFADKALRAISGHMTNYAPHEAVEKCFERARREGNEYFSVQYNTQCFTSRHAGATYAKYGAANG